jgi:hypothetical protein
VTGSVKEKDQAMDRERDNGYGHEARRGAPVDDSEAGGQCDEYRDSLDVARVIRSSWHISLPAPF